ncbi:MAG TPA: hypothetical protein VED17_08150 [Nitrososphaerales archaeon]|nr:hypothetical protein [Nitrososphaerales archaeon]
MRILQVTVLQTGTAPLDLIEWFLASVALVVVVTLVYVFVLNKSPPPEGLTEAKLEAQNQTNESIDVSPILMEAQTAVSNSNFKKAIELSVEAVGLILSRNLMSKGGNPANMNVSDLAYVIQTKSPGSPDITQPAYQLNLLHLKVERGESVTQPEADWSISTANWFSGLVVNSQI